MHMHKRLLQQRFFSQPGVQSLFFFEKSIFGERKVRSMTHALQSNEARRISFDFYKKLRNQGKSTYNTYDMERRKGQMRQLEPDVMSN